MTSQEATKYAVEERAAWIRLDSPQNRNALSVKLVEELGGISGRLSTIRKCARSC